MNDTPFIAAMRNARDAGKCSITAIVPRGGLKGLSVRPKVLSDADPDARVVYFDHKQIQHLLDWWDGVTCR